MSTDPATLLRVEDLAIQFHAGGRSVTAVDGVGFTLARGRTLGIVGESGSGKSVTCLALPGLLPRPAARIVRGRAWYDGIDMLQASASTLQSLRGRRIGMVFQDPLAALNPYRTVGDQVAEPLRVHRLCPRAEARERAVQALAEVGIPDPARRSRDYPHEFSGGQRQRIMIAMALIAQPDLLIADEPTTALDVTVQAQILALLAQLQQRHGMAMIFVSHDLDVVAGIADDVLVMHGGRCVETGVVRDVLAAPREPYTRQLLEAIPRSFAAPRPAPSPDGAPLLQVDGLRVSYPGRPSRRPRDAVPALDDVSLMIRPGEILGLVGETGSGKSTLAHAVLRLLRPDAGRVRLGDLPWSDLDTAALRRARPRLQMIFQDPYASLNPRLTVFDCLAEALGVRGAAPVPDLRRQVEALLADVGLPADAADRYPHAFSGGQRQRIAIARALAPEPDLVIADEPVSALDVTVQAQILTLLLELARRRALSMLFISHDLAVIRHIADRVAVLHRGRIVEMGETRALFTAPAHEYTRALLASMPATLARARNFASPAGMRE